MSFWKPGMWFHYRASLPWIQDTPPRSGVKESYLGACRGILGCTVKPGMETRGHVPLPPLQYVKSAMHAVSSVYVQQDRQLPQMWT